MSFEQSRIIFFVLLSLILVWSVCLAQRNESGKSYSNDDRPKYTTYPYQGYMLIIGILIFPACAFILRGSGAGIQMMLSIFFSVFISISVYYVILMLALPFLRKYINARTCAVLWLLPNYLYYLINGNGKFSMPRPSFIIHASKNLVQIVFVIWMIGFMGVLIWNIIGHLRFRRQILKDAVAVSNEEILNLLTWEIKRARLEDSGFELVISPKAKTPLSVGLFKTSTVIVLPERNYNEDELTLIFRHEIIHIARRDVWLKFFMIFCTAMCWFNPLMWIAMRKSADDMELSCDETVLLDSDEDTRCRYAKLILFTAGDESGFTTCLSASASALRYRLKNIITPKKRFTGALLIGVVFFLLCISCGHIALAYEVSTGAEILYSSENFEQYALKEIAMLDDSYDKTYEVVDEEAFHDYIGSLTMYELVGEYDYLISEYRLRIEYDTADGVVILYLGDNVIQLLTPNDVEFPKYYLPNGVDWEYLNSLLVELPELNLNMVQLDVTCGYRINATLQKLKKTENGETTILYESEIPIDNVNGFFRYTDASEAVLVFSGEPITDYTVRIDSVDGQSSYTVSQAELEQLNVIPLPDYPAYYTVNASFYGEDNALYEAEFRFNMKDVDE